MRLQNDLLKKYTIASGTTLVILSFAFFSGCMVHYGAPSIAVSFGYRTEVAPTDSALLTGTIYSETTDSGAVTPVALINVASTTYKTDSVGNFSIKLAPGIYVIHITRKGYSPIKLAHYKAEAGKVALCIIDLKKGDIGTEVNVNPEFKVLK